MVRLTIELSSKDGCYNPEDILKGTVTLNLNEPKKINGLFIKVIGKAEANWTKKSGKTSTYYEGKEVYLDQKTFLLGHEGNPPAVEVAAGTHSYNFEVLLPEDLPPSAELQKASIKYFVQGHLDIPFGFDKECKQEFKVVRKDDLNWIQKLKAPLMQRAEISTDTFFSRSSIPLVAKVSLPHSLFTPGSHIPVAIHLDNKSDKKIKNTEMKLKQLLKYTNGSNPQDTFNYKSTEFELVVAKGSAPGVEKETNKTIDGIVQIPLNICNTLKSNCKIIEVSYELQVKVHGHKMKFPIVISPVPLREEANDQNEDKSSTASEKQSSNNDSSAENKSPPPSFNEAIKE